MKVLLNASIMTDKHTGYATVINNFIIELSKYLNKNKNYNLKIYILIQSRAYNEFFANLKLHKNIKFILIPNINNVFRLIYDQAFINYFLKKYECDILHSPATLGTVFPIKPQILFFHASTTFVLPRKMHGRSFLATKISNMIIKQSVKKSAKILTTTEVTGKELENFLGEKIEFVPIYNGVPIVKKTFELTNIRPALRNLKEKKFILYVSSFYKLKNQEILVDAARKNSDIIFVLCGNPIQKKYYQYILDISKNLKNVHIYESINEDEKSFLYYYTYAYACPSLFEGFALTPLEALQFNKPILLSDIDVLHEVYGEGFIYFNPRNSKSIIEAINKIDENYIKFCTNNTLLNKYSWSNFLLKNIKIYEEVYNKYYE
jgi:glycosyltransferase involved in cell wall biosynthesis